jgi:hypothetical protein
MMRCSRRSILVLLAACRAAAPPTAAAPPGAANRAAPSGVELPVVVENQRWFLQTATAAGAPLRLFLDSAGGMYLTPAAAARLGLAIRHVGSDDGVSFPVLADPRIPRPPRDEMPVLGGGPFDDVDGMFGAPWFADHTVAFDYPARKLVVRTPGDLPTVSPDHAIAVAFPRDASGKVTSPYGRIQMIVDGETIDMLFDTGATMTLSDAALQQLGGTARARATGFITDDVFQRWRKAHPGWRVIERADRVGDLEAAIIEVPKLTVGGYEVGPAWFAWRPNDAFHRWMAEWMDRPTEGALGGSAFATLRITVDWAAGKATFER